MFLFLLKTTKEDILKNIGNQTVSFTDNFHCIDKKKKHWAISQNIIFYDSKKKASSTALEWHKSEEIMTEFLFLGELSL